ncbi:hypothetical protein CEXT_542561 [Caerostris extrusa]|uniref:Uncharacterized protein n=1 Tax=Caerostris extrusa TaxID=172846 RepID=A0AAV4XZ62_CAEEX|nr:hypothetical protein CEXT_542561 [Caerostris extrusa]
MQIIIFPCGDILDYLDVVLKFWYQYYPRVDTVHICKKQGSTVSASLREGQTSNESILCERGCLNLLSAMRRTFHSNDRQLYKAAVILAWGPN